MALRAKKLGDLVISLKGDTKQFNQSMSGAQKGMGGLKKAVIGLGVAYGALKVIKVTTRHLMKSIDAAGNAEMQLNKLRAMVRNVGNVYGYSEAQIELGTQALSKQALALMRTTGYSDDLIRSAQSMLSTFQLTPDQVAQITPRLLDMAAASEKSTGAAVDLQAMAIALGKGFTGMQGQLARYGVILSDETKKTGKFSDIIKDLDLNFQGASQAVGETYVGGLRIMRETMENTQKDLGEKFLPTLVDIIPHITRLADGLGNVFDEIESGRGSIAFLAETVKGLSDMFYLMTGSLERNEEEAQQYIDTLRNMKTHLTRVLEKQGEETDALTAATLQRIHERMELDKSLNSYEAYKLIIEETTKTLKSQAPVLESRFKTFKEMTEYYRTQREAVDELADGMASLDMEYEKVGEGATEVVPPLSALNVKFKEIGALSAMGASQVLNLAYSLENLFEMFSEEGGFSISRFLKALSGIMMMIPGMQGMGLGLGLGGVGAGMFGMKSGGLLIPAAQGIMVDRPTPILAGEGGQTEIVSPIDKFFDLVTGMQPNIVVHTGDPSTFVEFVEKMSAGNKDRFYRGTVRDAQERDLAR